MALGFQGRLWRTDRQLPVCQFDWCGRGRELGPGRRSGFRNSNQSLGRAVRDERRSVGRRAVRRRRGSCRRPDARADASFPRSMRRRRWLKRLRRRSRFRFRRLKGLAGSAWASIR